MRSRGVYRRQRSVGAQARGTDSLALVVDTEGKPDRVAGKRTEFLYLAVWLPYRGFKIEDLIRIGAVAWPFAVAVLRNSALFAWTPNEKSCFVVASLSR